MIVKPGDTLWGVAGRLLGDHSRWREIFALSRREIEAEQRKRQYFGRLRGPDLIFPGLVLRLPDR